ncbi:MAG: glutaredoxin family protein [Candidatus Dormibacteria bacterium]
MRPEQLELITRRRCPLCDAAGAALQREARIRDLRVSEFDVDEDPELGRHFSDRVPVIRFQGQVVAEGRVDPRQLRQALDGLMKSQHPPPDDSVTADEMEHDRG